MERNTDICNSRSTSIRMSGYISRSLFVLLVLLLSMTGCGKNGSPDASDSSTSKVDTSNPTGISIEIEGRHLIPEKLVRIPELDDTNDEYYGSVKGVGLCFLMQEDTFPTRDSEYGTLAKFSMDLRYDTTNDNSLCKACAVKVEPISGVDGYQARVTYIYYAQGSKDIPTDIAYKYPGGTKYNYESVKALFQDENGLETINIGLKDYVFNKYESDVPASDSTVLPASEAGLCEICRKRVEIVYDSAIQKLQNEGVIASSADADFSFDNATLEPIFNDSVKGSALTSAWKASEGGVVLAGPRFDVHANVYAEADATKAENYPAFFPISVSWGNTQVNWDNQAEPWKNYSDCFADSVDDWKYIVMYKDYFSRREEKYYAGGLDRVSVTTLVLVIDAQTEEIVHIKCIATDCPPGVNATSTTGSLMREEALDYIYGILK